MATEEDLQGYTMERLRELCAEKHISITTRMKEELISALMEARGPEPVSRVSEAINWYSYRTLICRNV